MSFVEILLLETIVTEEVTRSGESNGLRVRSVVRVKNWEFNIENDCVNGTFSLLFYSLIIKTNLNPNAG